MMQNWKNTLWAAIPILLFVGIFLINMLVYRNKEQGAVLYEVHCQSCHLEEGDGLRGIIPPLAKADYLQQHQSQLACLIRYGLQDTILVNGKQYRQAMPANETLTDTQISNIINYINTA
ncbi:MAG: cytochrome c, partial [Bacteroidota bacterium]